MTTLVDQVVTNPLGPIGQPLFWRGSHENGAMVRDSGHFIDLSRLRS